MRMTIAATTLAVLAGGWVASAGAADPPVGTQRPKILGILREEVKPGKGSAHEKNEALWPAALRKANSKGTYLAMTSGDQVWFLNPYPSFAAIEALAKEDEANATLTADVDRLWAADGDMLTRASSLTAVYNEELSYRADWDVAKIRYYAVNTVRIQPGYGRDYEELRRLVKAAHEKAKVEERWSVYEVVEGAADDTYVFFFPLTTLADMDKDEERHGKEYRDAVGEDTRGRLREFTKNAVRSSETRVFRLNPKMSYLPKEFVDRDPDFWTPKPVATVAKKTEKN